ncbi:uncharacterized protein PFL1_00457 [Pseudozyma flocculosa PF-1]|uniref:Succinylglutamate desuccinylase/Aspartoacylase catalytic domain-containing protein n=1 Tax=Pseudozyma flocculosa TaxID=84751 RepID=A0A5C3ERE1_9BASI|nr:uncharacterized protein PFL1_00457 [Pseudozyma flocculosa PF-1]EPQ32260.1 hypothetical protein PFL1_00457 [Pseudozyma flocculosa PF-1]SPO34788.1 uncharacterized protein PSFLO_00259 [Pseudozyma flocculosa]
MLPSTVLSALLPLAATLLPSALAKTVYTGDRVNGQAVISSLDTKDLDSSKVHRFYLRAGSLNSGHPLYVPVWVARGAGAVEDGKTFWVSTVVHGDELNGVRVAQLLLGDLEKAVENGSLNGTVIGVPGVNILGMSRNSRYVPSSSSGGLEDPNRLFPGVNASSGGSFVEDFIYNVWFGLTANGTQVDVAVDMHTQSTGGDTPMWGYADWRVPEIKKLSELAAVDLLKVDPGEPGSLETTFVEHGVPAITLEISNAKVWQKKYIKRSHEFLLRALDAWGILPLEEGSEAQTNYDPSRTYNGDTFVAHQTSQAGWWDAYVQPEDDVEAGQVLGKLYNTWGDELETIRAKASGKVHTVSADPAREAGSELVRLIRNGTAPKS